MSTGLGAGDRSPVDTSGERVRITGGPEIEKATDSWVIIRWITNNVEGTSLRYGVVHYGTDPQELSRTARSPNRWNGAHPTMIYRVEVNHLKPGTTYYYSVESANAFNTSEGPDSAVNQFTTEPSP